MTYCMTFVVVVAVVLCSSAYVVRADAPLTAAQAAAVVNQHNIYRATVANGSAVNSQGKHLPTAKNMYQISYSTALGAKAQNWSDQCKFEHSNAGQNLYAILSSSGLDKYDHAQLLRDATTAWYNELAQNGVYDNLTLTMDNYNHFTQVVWARSTLVGCGVTYCPSNSPPMLYAVCDYYEVGNYLGQQIYEAGKPCKADADCTTFAKSTCAVATGLCVQTVFPQAELDKYLATI